MSDRAEQPHKHQTNDHAERQNRNQEGAANRMAHDHQVGGREMADIRGKNQKGVPQEFGNLTLHDGEQSNMTRGLKTGSGEAKHKDHDDHTKDPNRKKEMDGRKPDEAGKSKESAKPKDSESSKAKEAAKPKESETAKPKPGDKADAKSDRAPDAKKSEPDHAEIVGKPNNVNPDNRNVVVLDSFKNDTHGRIIADSIESKGFNVYRAQQETDTNKLSGTEDMSKSLESINKKVEDGTLPLKKGDVVTLSMGQNKPTAAEQKQMQQAGVKPNPGDPTFAEASKDLKMKITPENLKEQKGQILDRMRLVADGKDPETGKPTETDPALQERMQSAVRTNDAITKLQDKGINVVHAAGNDGPDRFSMDTLAAKTDLDSRKPNGACDNFSACNSNTTKGDGVYQWKQVEPSLLDKTPEAKQKNDLRLDGAGANFPKYGTVPGMEQGSTLNRDALRPGFEGNEGASRPNSKPDVSNFAFNSDTSTAKPLSPMNGLKSVQSTYNNSSWYLDKNNRNVPPGQIGPPTDHFEKSQGPAPKETDLHVKPVEPSLERRETVTGTEVGTSFSVIRYLDGKANRNTSLDGS